MGEGASIYLHFLPEPMIITKEHNNVIRLQDRKNEATRISSGTDQAAIAKN